MKKPPPQNSCFETNKLTSKQKRKNLLNKNIKIQTPKIHIQSPSYSKSSRTPVTSSWAIWKSRSTEGSKVLLTMSSTPCLGRFLDFHPSGFLLRLRAAAPSALEDLTSWVFACRSVQWVKIWGSPRFAPYSSTWFFIHSKAPAHFFHTFHTKLQDILRLWGLRGIGYAQQDLESHSGAETGGILCAKLQNPWKIWKQPHPHLIFLVFKDLPV